MMWVECYECGEGFERKKTGRRSAYCTLCRHRARMMRQTARRQSAEDLADAVSKMLPSWVLSGEEIKANIVDLAQSYLPDDKGNRGIQVIPKHLDGAKTPAGPVLGWSTFDKTFAGELETRRREAISHEWWGANPHLFHDQDV